LEAAVAERMADDDEGGGKREETKRLARVLRVASFLTSQPYAWTRAGLATELEVSERSIDRDLELLRGLGYEINRDKVKGYAFARTPPLPPVQLSLHEVLALTLAAELARESGDIDTSSLGAAMAQLLSAVPAPARPLLQRELLRRAEGRERPSNTRRRAALATTQRAWLERRRLRITYATGMRGGELNERVIEPYAVHPYDGSWYVTAYDHMREKVIDFKINRIETATLLGESYAIPATFSMTEYRGATWGILRGVGGDPVLVELLFDEEGGRWVQEEQRTETLTFESQPDGHVLVRLTTSITPEFVRWIVWYGTHCYVRAPEVLRIAVRNALWQTLAPYDEQTIPSEEIL